MNTSIKMLVAVPLISLSGNATTIMFNGCTNTNNNSRNLYFNFTSKAGDEYCIDSCVPKSNPGISTNITLKIPGAVNGRQVSLGEEAFNWSKYEEEYSNLNVNLIFEKVGNMRVQMPTNSDAMFRESSALSKIAKISLDLSGISTSNVTRMGYMFHFCTRLTSLDVSNFDTSKVIRACDIFNNCSGLTSLDLSNFDTNTFSNVGHMFASCTRLTSLNLSNFTGSGIANYLDNMFNGCTSLTYLDISNIDARNAIKVSYMFKDCTALATLKISEYFSPPANTAIEIDTIFQSCNSNVNIVGTKVNQFIPANATVKSKINAGANKVYIYQTPSAWISDEFKEIVKEQLGITTFTQEPETTDISKIFTATSSDSLYIAQSKDNKTIVADASNKTISGALVNKTVDGIGYYPANLRLTGSITLSGDNSAFNQKSFLVGDGVKDTIITFTNPNALPKTNTTVESNGAVVFDGAENYILSNNISIKSGGKLNATTRIILAGNGEILKFEN